MESREDDLARLLSVTMNYAREMVNQEERIWPFAVVILQNGTTRVVAAEGQEANPRMGDLVRNLILAVRGQVAERGYRAAAICASGYGACPETGEAARTILISLETPEGDARLVAIPYSRGLMGSYVYHDPDEQPGRAVVFVPPGADTSPWLMVSRKPQR